jgi:1-deoxy-D-xylulose-5-phosphate reductoisomerase
MTQKTITILGSTGSVGKNTIDLIAANPDQFKIRALTARKNFTLLAEQAKKYHPEFVAIADESFYEDLKSALSGTSIKYGAGESAILEAASMNVDISMVSIVGVAGLKPVLTAIRHAKTVAIANKEPLVAAGSLVLSLAREFGTKILPVDSEHSAIFQVLESHNRDAVKKIILTASGGPFLNWPVDKIKTATIEQALAHPNWRMGSKISIDSATMMNKALEMIEAHYLFDMPTNKIDVIIHPQSIIHSMVEYMDGSVLAQLGAPDMRTPIAVALAYPNRMVTTGDTLDLTKLSTLTFEKPDLQKFPAIQLAYDCLNAGASHQIAFNAANEVAVSKFLNGEIPFGKIIQSVEKGISYAPSTHPQTLGDVLAIDEDIRKAIDNPFKAL